MFAEIAEQLLTRLDEVLSLLIRAKLKCKLSECALFAESLHDLCLVVSNASIQPEKTSWIAFNSGIS